MSAAAGPLPFRRDTESGLVAGVLAGLGERLGIDPVVLRVAFVVVAVASGGIALLAYLVAWAALPAADGRPAPLGRLARGSRLRRDWRVATGVGLLTLSALLAFRELGIWWSDAFVWPLVLAAFGVVLLWGRTRGAARASESRVPAGSQPAAAATGESPGVTGASAKQPSSSLAELYRGTFGVLLVLGAGLLFLSANHVLGGLRDAALTAVVVVVALGLILAPFLWRLARNLALERAERIRSQERAEFAAHLHDSVLQTLTLMQKRADDPREVAALARRQERELRDWLAGDRRGSEEQTFGAALRAAAEEVEDDHRVAIEVVVVGDCQLGDPSEAVLGATREALLNAAKHAGESGPIRVYAEVEDERIEVFVRDRGRGFDPAAVPIDRRGVRESIVGRMERAGGHAEIGSIPDGGTEVGLSILRPAREEGTR
ncbi:MAG TPA: PspC domain-containing protein [Solirubrobacterales bacterium]|nr:PspC domain-containing protein [Solirubrobacterales bacterium]